MKAFVNGAVLMLVFSSLLDMDMHELRVCGDDAEIRYD